MKSIISTVLQMLIISSFLFLLNGCATLDSKSIQNAKNLASPVFIGEIKVSSPNSAGGRSIYFTWNNTSNKTIKYLTINYSLYNAVGDRVFCRIGPRGGLRFTGPVSPGNTKRGRPTSLCYDTPAIRGEVRNIVVIYMDDSRESFNRQQLLEMGALAQ